MSYNENYVSDKANYSASQIEDYRQAHLVINREISQKLNQPNRATIQDGIFDYEGYLRAKFKIMWLMKEPYDRKKGDSADTPSGGWHISEIYKYKSFGAARTTWYPIIYTSHALLNNFEPYNQIKRINSPDSEVVNVLSHVSYVNVQKLPSLTREKTDNAVILKAFRDHKELFQKQFDLINPDIIIGASTLNHDIVEHFKLQGKQFKKSTSNEAYSSDGKLFIRAKHPAQRGSTEVYVNDIVSATKDWFAAKNL